jgi:hypothetical protein
MFLFQKTKDTEEISTITKKTTSKCRRRPDPSAHSTGGRGEVIRILAGTGLEHVRHDVDIVVARQLARLRVKPQLVSNTEYR